MPLDEHMGPIFLQHALSAGVNEVPGCRQAIAGFAMVISSKAATMPSCANRVNNTILRYFAWRTPSTAAPLPFLRFYVARMFSGAHWVRSAAVLLPGRKIAPNDQRARQSLRCQGLHRWKYRKPQAHPGRNNIGERRNDRCREPMRQLHFLGLFAGHNEEHGSQQNARQHQHLVR